MNITKEYRDAIKLWIVTEKYTLEQAAKLLGYSDKSSLKRILNGGGASPERIREKFDPYIKKYVKPNTANSISIVSRTIEKNDQLFQIFNMLKDFSKEDIKLFSNFLKAFNEYKK